MKLILITFALLSCMVNAGCNLVSSELSVDVATPEGTTVNVDYESEKDVSLYMIKSPEGVTHFYITSLASEPAEAQALREDVVLGHGADVVESIVPLAIPLLP